MGLNMIFFFILLYKTNEYAICCMHYLNVICNNVANVR